MAERFMVSTDSSGVLGIPRHWKEVWEPAIEHKNFAGFEAISWIWICGLLEKADKEGIKIGGFHGKTGNNLCSSSRSDRLLTGIVNSMLMTTDNLFHNFGNNGGYVLIHEPETRKHANALGKNRRVINDLRIENHPDPGSLERTYEVVRELRENGINAGLMVDLFHLFNEFIKMGNNDRPKVIWSKVRKSVGNLLDVIDSKNDPVPVSFHVPVGLNKNDSLPTTLLTREVFRDIARMTDRKGTFVVLENQQGGLNMIITTEKSRKRQRDRNEELLNLLVKHSVI
ncbi:MAG TPA: hypothetical protein VI795_01880 [Patescibacteria group bacterium]|nr:hypothetical protein [Patescibacteria group bacterium]